jgi:hypothetical protein
MKKNYSIAEHQFMIHSGVGVANYFIRDEGHFQVRYRGGIQEFTTLVKAYLFYVQLGEEASVWDMTVDPILVESKIWK